MKTNLLQSQLHRNATAITGMVKVMIEAKADAKAAQLEVSRRYHRALVLKLARNISMLAAIQCDIKRDLMANKLARLQGPKKKHGKDDPRYTSWLALSRTQPASCAC